MQVRVVWWLRFRAQCVATMLAPIIALLVMSAPLRAQTVDLAGFWNMVEAQSIGDAPAVLPLGDSVSRDVARGLLMVREHELTNSRPVSVRAVSMLERIVERNPDHAWANFALGAALARGPDVHVRWVDNGVTYNTYKRFSNAAVRAPRFLRRALELDPGLTAAAIELSRLANNLDDAALKAEAVRYVAATDPVEGAGHRGDRASLAFERAQAGFRVRGREKEAAGAYFDGLALLTDAAARAYYSNIEVLLTATEADAWRQESNAGRAAFLDRYWKINAALAGVPVERRLAEHFTRVAQAEELLFRMANTGTKDPTPLQQKARPAVQNKIRHGDAPVANKYKYCPPGWDTLPSPEQPTVQQCRCSPYGRMIDKMMGYSACGMLGILSSHYPRDEMTAMGARHRGRQADDHAAKGQSYYPPYKVHAALEWDVYRFRGADGGIDVVAGIALAAQSARAMNDGGAQLSLIVVDTVRGTVDEMQTDMSLRVSASGDAVYSSVTLSRDVPFKLLPLRVRLEDAAQSAGRIMYGTLVPLHADSSGLSMSDIVVASGSSHGQFMRGTVAVPFTASDSVRGPALSSLYYEVYGVRPGQAITTTVHIEQVVSGVRRLAALVRKQSATSITFSEAAAHSTAFGIQQLREIDLNVLEPGSYKLRITVTDDAGRSVRGERLIEIPD